ncbi:MAG: 23S rRNA (adenine(2503)-C(2))-methyltransferase RlmN, partial [Nitrospinota bacterium]|nr:23S rRNA (adenine(2503)-C(2))-methyltransferase RlmN [Nitrospinota bacterium]
RALEEFPLPRGRRITLEYVLLEGVNDSQADAERLGRFAKRFPSKINLIPFNPAPGINFGRPSDQKVEMFKKWLFEMDIPAFIRKSKGQDILAACGQLRGARP